MSKRVWILTLFPGYFNSFFENGVIASAISGERSHGFDINLVSISDYSEKSFKGVDASPYGGGAGMVMRADVLEAALLKGVVEAGNYSGDLKNSLHIVYPDPRGESWTASLAKDFSKKVLNEESDKDVVFICGRYEGIDERFIEKYVDQQICIGDFVLTGGELAVMTILDSALRFVPGVLGNQDSNREESFENYLLEHPQYTRPSEFAGLQVPEVLTSGNHKKIKEFKLEQRKNITKKYRADMWQKYLTLER